MRIMEVIGTVTLNRCHPSLEGACLKLAVPLSLADLAGQTDRPGAGGSDGIGPVGGRDGQLYCGQRGARGGHALLP